MVHLCVLPYTTVYYHTLQCTTIYSVVLTWPTMYYQELQCITMFNSVFPYTMLYYFALQFTTIHYNVWPYNMMNYYALECTTIKLTRCTHRLLELAFQPCVGKQIVTPLLERNVLKLDGVSPVDNRPSTNKLHHFVKKNTKKTWHLTCDMWHVTCDTWHMTCDMWHVTRDMWHVTWDMLGGREGGGTFSKNISTPALPVKCTAAPKEQ